MNTYGVRVTKDFLLFSAGHFISFDGDHCERLHGHNWRAAIELEGDLDANHYVFDFITLLDLSRAIVATLDHRMLLPDGTGLISVLDNGPNWRVVYKDRFWSFPKNECVVLPIPNTTTERIASWFNDRLRQAIQARGLGLPRSLRVEIEENLGQVAWSTWQRG
jgi:6-pyruvoyltetrahydropterin/6-carboxytetrahydropterin synthase